MNDSPRPLPVLGRALTSGDLELFRKLIEQEPYRSLLTQDRLNFYLRTAARENHVEFLPFLVGLGADLHAVEEEGMPEGCIDNAARNGAVEAVSWLLQQGANVDDTFDGVRRSLPLSGASFRGHLEVVKLLVERGADFNAVWNGMNALSFAEMYNQTAVVDYLRSKGAKTPAELRGEPPPAATPQDVEDRFLAHLEEHLGPPEPLTLQQIVPGDPPIAIHLVRMQSGVALVTHGMASRAMMVPKEAESLKYAELVMYLPEGWPLDAAALADPSRFWPIEQMLKIARWPHANRSWLGGKAVVFADDEPPRPFAPNTELCCLLAMTEAGGFGSFPRAGGGRVVFYTLIPLYREERDLEMRDGTIALVERFEARGVSRVVDLARPNVAT